MTETKNFYDDLQSGFDPSEAMKIQKDYEAKAAKLDYLIHRTFEQGESGKELLDYWKTSLVMQPVAEGGLDLIDIGIREGYKRFIRGIILTIERVERGER